MLDFFFYYLNFNEFQDFDILPFCHFDILYLFLGLRNLSAIYFQGVFIVIRESMDLVVQPRDKGKERHCKVAVITLYLQDPGSKIDLHGKTLGSEISIFICLRLMFHVLDFATVCDTYVRGVSLNRVTP